MELLEQLENRRMFAVVAPADLPELSSVPALPVKAVDGPIKSRQSESIAAVEWESDLKDIYLREGGGFGRFDGTIYALDADLAEGIPLLEVGPGLYTLDLQETAYSQNGSRLRSAFRLESNHFPGLNPRTPAPTPEPAPEPEPVATPVVAELPVVETPAKEPVAVEPVQELTPSVEPVTPIVDVVEAPPAVEVAPLVTLEPVLLPVLPPVVPLTFSTRPLFEVDAAETTVHRPWERLTLDARTDDGGFVFA